MEKSSYYVVFFFSNLISIRKKYLWLMTIIIIAIYNFFDLAISIDIFVRQRNTNEHLCFAFSPQKSTTSLKSFILHLQMPTANLFHGISILNVSNPIGRPHNRGTSNSIKFTKKKEQPHNSGYLLSVALSILKLPFQFLFIFNNVHCNVLKKTGMVGQWANYIIRFANINNDKKKMSLYSNLILKIISKPEHETKKKQQQQSSMMHEASEHFEYECKW